MGLRVQVSLQFADETMFDEFIVPHREDRSLNALIVRCLTAYYNSPDVRALIDDDVVDVESTEDLISNMRSFIAMQDVLVSSLEDTITEGTNDFTQVVNKINKSAKNSGVTPTNTAALRGSTASTDDVVLQSNQVAAIFDALTILASAIGAKDAIELIDRNRGGIPRLESKPVSQPQVTVEQPIVQPAPAPVVTPVAQPVYQQPVTPQPAAVAQTVPPPAPAPAPASVAEPVSVSEPVKDSSDARSAMLDLLGSL